jgi:tight adherence protein B
MNEREALVKFNALLAAGLSLQQAERVSGVAQLDGESGQRFRFFRALCLRFGASPAPAMARLQAVLEARADAAGRLAVAEAGPRSTARLVYWLPPATLVIGQLAGLGAVEVFWRAPLSLLSLMLGAILLLLANLWSTRMLRGPAQFSDDFVLDAFAVCLDSGLEVSSVRTAIESEFDFAFGREISVATLAEIDAANKFGGETGTAISKVLSTRADELRRNSNYKNLERIEKLSVKLLWPLGICVLPAFVFISVIPMSIALLTKG